MRLAKVAVKNFRCYSDWTTLHISSITSIIGRNEAGKSAILDALQIFFDDTAPEQDDADIRNREKSVGIACTFDDVPVELVIDAEHPTNLEREHLLNTEGLLEIHKVYNCKLKKPKIEGVFANCLHPAAEGASDLLQLKNAGLKERARSLDVSLDDVDERINTQLRQAIWDSFADLSVRVQLIPLAEETAKKVWDQLKAQLPVYALFKSDRSSTDQDAEAQDPMKAAIKEAIKEKEPELDEIAQHVERKVKDIARRTVDKLREMDPDLAAELKPRFTTPAWANIFKVSLADDTEVPINKRGSGVRRLILLNFFRAKAEQLALDRTATNVIYAVEEPETSQHPDNQRMLVRAFGELSAQPDCQVLLTTHVPALARLLPLDSLRYLEVQGDGRRTFHAGDDETYGLISRALGVLPDTNVRLFVGIEGPNDISFLTTLASALIAAGEDVPDLQKLERDGYLIFVPLGGQNLAYWTSRLAELNIPEFYIFDRGEQPPRESEHQGTVDELNRRDNCTAVLTDKAEMENYLHADAISEARSIAVEFADFDDVPALVARAVHEASETVKPWDEVSDQDRKKKESRAKTWLNSEAAGRMTPARLKQTDPNDEVRGWLATIASHMST